MAIGMEFSKAEGILVLRPEGAIEAGDFEAVAAEVDPFLEQEGELRGLMVDAPHFPGWKGFEGFVSHLKFVRAHHERIGKVAFVSDSAILKSHPAIGRHFVGAELRQFSSDRKEAAKTWLLAD